MYNFDVAQQWGTPSSHNEGPVSLLPPGLNIAHLEHQLECLTSQARVWSDTTTNTSNTSNNPNTPSTSSPNHSNCVQTAHSECCECSAAPAAAVAPAAATVGTTATPALLKNYSSKSRVFPQIAAVPSIPPAPDPVFVRSYSSHAVTVLFCYHKLSFQACDSTCDTVSQLDLFDKFYSCADKLVTSDRFRPYLTKLESTNGVYVVCSGALQPCDQNDQLREMFVFASALLRIWSSLRDAYASKSCEHEAVASLESAQSVGTVPTGSGVSRVSAVSAVSKNLGRLRDLAPRIGISSGEGEVGAIIGKNTPQFHLFGNVINLASRLASTSEPNRIQTNVSYAQISLALQEFGHYEQFAGLNQNVPKLLEIEPRRETVDMKGFGRMQTFWVNSGDSCACAYVRNDSNYPECRQIGPNAINVINASNALYEVKKNDAPAANNESTRKPAETCGEFGTRGETSKIPEIDDMQIVCKHDAISATSVTSATTVTNDENEEISVNCTDANQIDGMDGMESDANDVEFIGSDWGLFNNFNNFFHGLERLRNRLQPSVVTSVFGESEPSEGSNVQNHDRKSVATASTCDTHDAYDTYDTCDTCGTCEQCSACTCSASAASAASAAASEEALNERILPRGLKLFETASDTCAIMPSTPNTPNTPNKSDNASNANNAVSTQSLKKLLFANKGPSNKLAGKKCFVTMLYADFKGYTKLCRKLSASQGTRAVVDLLHKFVFAIDCELDRINSICAENSQNSSENSLSPNLHKLDVIGDAVIIVAGLDDTRMKGINEDPVAAMNVAAAREDASHACQMALKMLDIVDSINLQISKMNEMNRNKVHLRRRSRSSTITSAEGEDWEDSESAELCENMEYLDEMDKLELRIGLHSDWVIPAMIGSVSPKFWIYGAGCAVAEKMEQTGHPGKVQITHETRELLLAHVNNINNNNNNVLNGVNGVHALRTRVTRLDLGGIKVVVAPRVVVPKNSARGCARGAFSARGELSTGTYWMERCEDRAQKSRQRSHNKEKQSEGIRPRFGKNQNNGVLGVESKQCEMKTKNNKEIKENMDDLDEMNKVFDMERERDGCKWSVESIIRRAREASDGLRKKCALEAATKFAMANCGANKVNRLLGEGVKKRMQQLEQGLKMGRKQMHSLHNQMHQMNVKKIENIVYDVKSCFFDTLFELQNVQEMNRMFGKRMQSAQSKVKEMSKFKCESLNLGLNLNQLYSKKLDNCCGFFGHLAEVVRTRRDVGNVANAAEMGRVV